MKKINVFLATINELLEEGLMSDERLNILLSVKLKEEIILELARLNSQGLKPEVLILSSNLEGNVDLDILDIMWHLRNMEIRVIYLAGKKKPKDITIKKVANMAVYDILFEPVAIGAVLDKIFNPTPASIGEKLADPKYKHQVKPEFLAEIEGKDNISEASKRILGAISKASDTVKNMNLKTKAKTREPYRNVNVVWSPEPTGKTFTAINYSATMALLGYDICLIDAGGSVWSWLNMQKGDDGFTRALSNLGDPLSHAFQPELIEGLYVLSNATSVTLQDKHILTLIEVIKDQVDLVVIDTPSVISSDILSLATNVILVTDMDFSHLKKLQQALDKLENENLDFSNFLLLLNKYKEFDDLPIKEKATDASGFSITGIIPEMYDVTMKSIFDGRPAVYYDLELRAVFESIEGVLAPSSLNVAVNE